MSNFVKLSAVYEDGDLPIWVNLDRVSAVRARPTGGSNVVTADTQPLVVRELPEEFLS